MVQKNIPQGTKTHNESSRGQLHNMLENDLEAITQQLTAFAMEQQNNERGSQALLPQKAQKERFEQHIREGLQHVEQRMQHGATAVLAALKQYAIMHPEINMEAIQNDFFEISMFFSQFSGNKEDFTNRMQQEMTLQEICNMSDETLEALYQAAKSIYEQKRYEDAVDAFVFLTTINETRYPFWFALGNALYFCKNFDAACRAYTMAAELNPTDSTCLIFMSKCYEELCDFNNAVRVLDQALTVIEDIHGDNNLKDAVRAERMRLAQHKTKEYIKK